MATIANGRYSPLLGTEIRLVHLSADLDDPVSGQFEVVTLENAPPYYALSHAWVSGGPAEGISEGEKIRLNSNLSSCIRRLQELSAKKPGLDPPLEYIWLDSICINQKDTVERSSQVALMGRIYKQSVRTLIWLGEEDSVPFHRAWQLIADMYAIFRKQNPTATSLTDINLRIYDEQSQIALGLPPWDDLRWTYLKLLMELRWFSRIWIVQEVVLSRQDPIFLQSNYRYAWEPLSWAVAWMRRSGYMRLPQIPEQLRNIDTISNLRRARTHWPLDCLMSITQIKFHASDQRDKVYGLLGLSTECQDSSAFPDDLNPDYNIDVPVLYQRVARFLLRRNRSLAILTRARGLDGTLTAKQRQFSLGLPSWCPDWSDFTTANLGISTSLSWIEYSDTSSPAILGYPKQYKASGDLKADFSDIDRNSNDELGLQLSGFKIDEVSHVHRFDIGRPSDGEPVDDLDATMAPILKLSLLVLSSHDILAWAKSFIETTTANQHPLTGKDTNQAFADGAAYLCGFLERNKDIASLFVKQSGENAVIAQLREASMEGTPGHFEALVRNFCFDRAFILTLGGRMGIAPSNTWLGDKVCVLLGGGVPCLIRPSEEHWLFVGEAYVDGVMTGETIRDCKEGAVSKETFSFR